MKNKNYLLIKETHSNEIIYIDYNKLDGFKVKPKNKVKYDGIEVNKMLIIKPSLIEKMLKRKIKYKLNTYLQHIIMAIEESDDSDSENLKIVLDDINRYRQLLKNKYRKYLEEKYYKLLLKKIALLEQELKKKILNARISQYKYGEKVVVDEKAKKSR